MTFIKKKITQVFSDGSINMNSTFLKKLNKVKVSKKDHASFALNKKDSGLFTRKSKDFDSFKTRYLKF